MKSNTIDLISFAANYRGVEDATIPPAGCLYVGGALKQAGFKVKIYHLTSKDIKNSVHTICSEKPMFVGLSVITGSPVVHSAIMSRMIKEISPDIPIVWGGIHPSLMPESCLKEKFIDFVVIGEGEETAVSLAEGINTDRDISDLPGIGYKNKNDKIIINQPSSFIKNLDIYKQDWSLLDPKKYIRTSYNGKKYFIFITSRGCPYNCGFCYNQSFNKRRWREHSSSFVIDQIKQIKDITDIDYVVFNDDNFLVNKKRAIDILKGLREIGVTATWIELRLDQFDENILSELTNYGVKTIFVGWESGSNRTLSRIDKGFNTDLIINSFKMAKRFNLEIDASAIVGFPFEDQADIYQTIKMVGEINSINPGKNKFNIGVYLPYPGTEIVKEALSRGFNFPENIYSWDSYDILKGEMSLPWLSKYEIKKISRIDRYGKMLYIGDVESRHFSFTLLIQKIFYYLSVIRFKLNFFSLPFETYCYDLAVKLYLKSRILSTKKN